MLQNQRQDVDHLTVTTKPLEQVDLQTPECIRHLGEGCAIAECSRLVEWAGKQGRAASWMHDLFAAMEREPHEGDSLDLALSHDGEDMFRVKTVSHNGALYIGVDETGRGVDVISIRQANGAPLPDTVARITAQDVVFNIQPDGKWLELAITGKLADGRRVTWQISVNPDSGEVLPAAQAPRPDQHAAVIERMRQLLMASQPLSLSETG